MPRFAPPPVNLDLLIDVSDGNREEMQQLVKLYENTIRGHLRKLPRAIDRQEYAEVASLAHSAAGSSAVIGMTSIVPLFKDMERQGALKDLSNASDLLNHIQTAFSRIRGFLKTEKLLKESYVQKK